MSIDLEWLKLDASLASHLVDLLNRQLDNVERPSFIGPVQVTSLDFGSNAPDVELVDLRDIYRDFLEDDESEDQGPVKVTEGGNTGIGLDEEEGYEWVSRRAGVRRDSGASGSGGHHHFLPPHVRHHGYGAPGDYFSAASIPNTDSWSSGFSRPPGLGTHGIHSFGTGSGPEVPIYRSPSPATPFVPTPKPSRGHLPERDAAVGLDDRHELPFPLASTAPHFVSQTQNPPESHGPASEQPTNPHPNLQLHFHVNWHSNLRISLQTSLHINYPSPLFMSLPIRLSITGLVFNGELAVAYEGERKRIHLCILDDLDPYGPASSRRMSNLATGSNSSLNSDRPAAPGSGVDGLLRDRSNASAPPDLDDSIIMGAAGLGLGGLNSLGVGNTELSQSNLQANLSIQVTNISSSGSGLGKTPLNNSPVAHTRQKKPVLPIGQRLLPSIFIESEIGQTDKHVLKNVTRVERFIQDVIRKTVEEELVFPNFHTLVMGET